MNDLEIWRDIPGHKGYQVSSHGRVRNMWTYNILGCGIHNGRVRVNLYNKTNGQRLFHVHRLVAMAFLPDYRPDVQVVHINGDYQNNHHSNLVMGKHGGRALPKTVSVQILETGQKYPSLSAAARAVGGQQSNVARVLEGTLKHHKGHTFRLVTT